MGDAAFDLRLGERGAELEDLDVCGLTVRLERGEINRARARRAVVAPGKLHVVDVEAEQAVALGFEVQSVVDEAEVFLDLRVAGVVPVDHGGAGQSP